MISARYRNGVMVWNGLLFSTELKGQSFESSGEILAPYSTLLSSESKLRATSTVYEIYVIYMALSFF